MFVILHCIRVENRGVLVRVRSFISFSVLC